MNAGSSLFLRLHPRLIQLLTVTPVRSTVSSSQLKDGNPTLDYDDGAAREDEGSREKWTLAHVLAVGSNDTKVVEKERREFGVDYMLDVIAIVLRYAERCESRFRRRQIRALDEVEAVEAIRTLAELVVWGDQHDETLWDIFMDKEVMRHLSQIVSLTDSMDVKRQCMQSLSIMVQSFENKKSLYNLFSRNFINEIIGCEIDANDFELVGHVVSIIRGITNKLDDNLLEFFFDEKMDVFPLYDQATRLFDHREAMFRIAVRNVTLSIYSLGDQRVLDCVTRNAQSPTHFFNRIFAFANELETILRLAFAKGAAVSLSRPVLLDVADYICELESVMEYVNEAVSTNETSIGAFLGGAAIREFVQPPLYELAAHARADKESIQATQAGACVLVWHLAMCLELLTHKLVGRALVVEVLSAFSENGRTPCQGLKALAATSSDERCVHMALCAMEALISYPLCEYDDLVAAGCALPRRHDASHREHDREEDVQEKASIRSSSSDIIRYQSSSLTGYDLVTGNQALKTLSITVSEDGGDEEDRRLSDGIGTFREMFGSIFRWERATRSVRVIQAGSRIILAIAKVGDDEVRRECTAIAAVLLMEYICFIRGLLEDDIEASWLVYDALTTDSNFSSLKKPSRLHDTLVSCDTVENRGFHYPMTKAALKRLREEEQWRRKRRHGSAIKSPDRCRGGSDPVSHKFAQLDAGCLLALTWLNAELNSRADVIRNLETALQKTREMPKTNIENVREAVLHVFEIASVACLEIEVPGEADGEEEIFVGGEAEVVEGGAEVVEGEAEAAEEESEVVERETEAVEGKPEAVEGEPEVVEGEPEVVEGRSKVVKGEAGQKVMEEVHSKGNSGAEVEQSNRVISNSERKGMFQPDRESVAGGASENVDEKGRCDSNDKAVCELQTRSEALSLQELEEVHCDERNYIPPSPVM